MRLKQAKELMSDFMLKAVNKMAENNTVLVVAVLAVIASLAAAGFSYYAMSQGPKVLGFATNTDSGVANLTVETAVEIEFSDDAIEWGSGRVAYGQASATLDTSAGSVTNGNWTIENSGLVLDNVGNVNVSVDLAAVKTAAVFLGGTSPDYDWKVSETAGGEAGTCTGMYVTGYENTNSSARICDKMGYLTGANELRIDIKLVVPYDSNRGYLSDTITATAAAN